MVQWYKQAIKIWDLHIFGHLSSYAQHQWQWNRSKGEQTNKQPFTAQTFNAHKTKSTGHWDHVTHTKGGTVGGAWNNKLSLTVTVMLVTAMISILSTYCSSNVFFAIIDQHPCSSNIYSMAHIIIHVLTFIIMIIITPLTDYPLPTFRFYYPISLCKVLTSFTSFR